MWFIGVEVEQETSAPPPKKNPGSAPELCLEPKLKHEGQINLMSHTSKGNLLYVPLKERK